MRIILDSILSFMKINYECTRNPIESKLARMLFPQIIICQLLLSINKHFKRSSEFNSVQLTKIYSVLIICDLDLCQVP